MSVAYLWKAGEDTVGVGHQLPGYETIVVEERSEKTGKRDRYRGLEGVEMHADLIALVPVYNATQGSACFVLDLITEKDRKRGQLVMGEKARVRSGGVGIKKDVVAASKSRWAKRTSANRHDRHDSDRSRYILGPDLGRFGRFAAKGSGVNGPTRVRGGEFKKPYIYIYIVISGVCITTDRDVLAIRTRHLQLKS